MGLSTNATCQLEKPESSHAETRGSTSTSGLSAPPRDASLPTGENAWLARTYGMFGIRAERGKTLLSTKRALEVGAETVWLPGMDSNHDSRLQRPLSYH